jgi:hypothetical protein
MTEYYYNNFLTKIADLGDPRNLIYIPDTFIGHIYDFGNYSIFCLIFYFFYKKNKISKNFFMILCLLMLTPFLFNNSILSWELSPDQNKYVRTSSLMRTYGIEYFMIYTPYILTQSLSQIKMISADLFFALSPLITMDTVKSIGFLNRFLLLSTATIMLQKKKITHLIFLVTVLSPGLTYYSSVSLREMLILLSMVWSVYFFSEKKYFIFSLVIFYTFLLKYQNALIVLSFIFLYYLFFTKNKLIFKSLILLIFLGLFVHFLEPILLIYNNLRAGLFSEAYGHYKGITSAAAYQNLEINMLSLFVIIKSSFNFITSPMLNLYGTLNIVFFIETVMLYIFLYNRFHEMSKNNTLMAFLWFIVLLFSFLIYGTIIFNDGTIYRYRLIIIYFIIYSVSIYQKKQDKKNFV